MVTELADTVLPLIRTRADLHWRSASSAHGGQMYEAVSILSAAAQTGEDPADVFAVTQKAIASSLKLIMRADDSDGIMGDAIRQLLKLHADTAAPAQVSPAKLVDWMIKFQFENDCDFFTIDPVRYASALTETGVARYRRRLDEIRESRDPIPDGHSPWATADGHARFMLRYNDQRLAVLDRDVEAIIRTHARDEKVAAWLEDTAQALAEIDQYDLAIDWAQRATYFGLGHQSLTAAETWCDLLAAHRPEDLLAALLDVFRRWPSSSTAARLYGVAGAEWPTLRDEVTEMLSANPRDAVSFSLNTIGDLRLAWEQAHALSLTDVSTWLDLTKKYEKIDPLAVLEPLRWLVEAELESTGPRHYKVAARHLKRMSKLAARTERASDVDTFIADLREHHRRRPRLQTEFDKAGLP